jgi:hypothetical protein
MTFMRFRKGTSLSSAEGASEGCDYSIQAIGHHVRLVVGCKECGGKASLLERDCRNGVLETLLEEPMPSSIILSGYIETLYEGDAVALIQMMTDILRMVNGFCGRKTEKDSERCSKCKKSPVYVFKKVEKAYKRNLPAFNREVKIQSSGLSGDRDSCNGCLKSTKSDLQSLLGEANELKSFILKSAFKISDSGT